MTIKTIALATAFILTATTAQASKFDLSKEFCGDRYCGLGGGFHQSFKPYKSYKKSYARRHKAISHKKKIVRLASLTPIISEKEIKGGLAAEAAKYIGMNARQLGVRLTLWCSAFVRKVTKAHGVDDRAFSWLRKPRIKPRINAIAVLKHSHVGIVAGFAKNGDPIIISGNSGSRNNRRVTKHRYPKHQILAYVTI